MNLEKNKKRGLKKSIVLLVSVVMLTLGIVGGTLAYLISETDPVKNTFAPSEVSCYVDEILFDGITKTGVSIENTGNTDAYIRAMVLVTWKDAQGNVYGQAPNSTDYSISYNESDWTQIGDYWYCNQSVIPDAKTDVLIKECKKVGTAPTGYDLSVEIIADAIQSEPANVVQQSWGVTISEGSVAAYTAQ